MVLGRRLDSPLALPWPLSVDVIFGSPPPGLSKIRGVIAVEVQGTGACCHVVGSLEPLLGGAGRLEVGPTDRPREATDPPVVPAIERLAPHAACSTGTGGDQEPPTRASWRWGPFLSRTKRWSKWCWPVARSWWWRAPMPGGLVCQGEQRPGTADRFEGAPERCCA